jgi:hypothetical protein
MTRFILAALLTLSFAAGAVAADKKQDYQYDKYNNNGSWQDRSTSSEQKAMEKKTYDTQTNINKSYEYMNKGNATSAPGNYDTKVYSGGRGAKTIEK